MSGTKDGIRHRRIYWKNCSLNSRSGHETDLEIDDLLLKDRCLRNLESPRPQHYQSLYNWILGYKPLDGGQYDFLFHKEDFVSSMESNHESRFDEIIEWLLSRWPSSRLLQTQKADLKKTVLGKTSESKSKKISSAGIYTFSRTKAVIVAKVLALIITFTILLMPVMLLYLKPMSNAARARMVLVFVLAFATLMSLFLKARVEVLFIGTCTYYAVLVTFLGNVGIRDSV
ncbi:hypothetical protein HYALB_00007829 [Hymenoscyphus albidus]|uniref:DUF6594 domain-containing protein n=1 Tax=Hymenoscyphus albidus TaxID=595503 RepID=A0A9N9LDU7_9HELO|nr:hypothetical protein HYALB_00007829 [Hymenoscyphus albidus]